MYKKADMKIKDKERTKGTKKRREETRRKV